MSTVASRCRKTHRTGDVEGTFGEIETSPRIALHTRLGLVGREVLLGLPLGISFYLPSIFPFPFPSFLIFYFLLFIIVAMQSFFFFRIMAL